MLANFSKGLAGGGPVPRSRFIYDFVNLPEVGGVGGNTWSAHPHPHPEKDVDKDVEKQVGRGADVREGGEETRNTLCFGMIHVLAYHACCTLLCYAVMQVINNMAAQTVVNNMDRCTKNFFMYNNPKTQEWYM